MVSRILQNNMKSSTLDSDNKNQKCYEVSRKQSDIRTGLKLTSNDVSNSKVMMLLHALRMESCSQGILKTWLNVSY